MESKNNIGIDKHQKMHSDDNNSSSNNNNDNNNGNTFKPEYSYHSSSPSSPSSSSSSSSSSANSKPLEIDIDEKGTNEHGNRDQSSKLEWNSSTTLPTVSPPLQVMGRPTGYDPHRIPSSVFVSKPTSAMEWSMASNESLFSIQMGNTSFSREQFNLMKSGELKSPEEWMSSTSSLPPINGAKTNEPSLPVVIEGPSDSVDKESVDCEETCETSNATKVCAGENEKGKHFGAHIPNGHGNPPASRLSDGSSTQSNMSFAFPVFGGETPNKKQEPKHENSERVIKPVENKWFLYFSCCTFWR